VDGSSTELLSQDAAWETPVIEGPAVVRAGDTYYLFYGGAWWESSRASIGYATARKALGPYVKATRRHPWLASRRSAAGPGGPHFFRDVDGAMWMAYHAWEPGRVGYADGGVRSLWLDRLRFTADRPVLGLETSG
jgi:beta-xylosidase